MATPIEALGILGVFQTCLHGARQIHRFIRSYRKIDEDMVALDLRLEEAIAYLWSFGRIHNLIVQDETTPAQGRAALGHISPSWKDLADKRLVIAKGHINQAKQILSKYATTDDDDVQLQPSSEPEPFDTGSIPTRSPTLQLTEVQLASRRSSIKNMSLRRKSTWPAKDKKELTEAVSDFEQDVKALFNLTMPRFWILMHESTASALKKRSDEVAMNERSLGVSNVLDEGQRVRRELDARELAKRLDDESQLEKESRCLDFLSKFAHLAQEDLPDQPFRTATDLAGDHGAQSVLVEWKGYDKREISREQTIRRVSDVVCMLNSPAGFLHNVLPSAGFFEDPRSNNSPLRWVGIVYNTSSLGNRKKMRTLRELLSKPEGPVKQQRDSWKPPLGDRFRLALRIAETLLAVHNCGWFHKGIRPENIVFFTTSGNSITDPYLLGWEYSRSGNPGEKSEELRTQNADVELYQHPDYFQEVEAGEGRYKTCFDHYQLGCVLLEIGMWKLLGDMGRMKRGGNAPVDAEWQETCRLQLMHRAKKLAVEMGEIYTNVVLKLLSGLHEDGRDGEFWDVAVLQLARCCA
ncbi:hypothetical protein GQ53DRAFT_758276 [Thozetella sp. PMI_491]|nr:hypothetical protein GQ53DRAFT_758276 [Thozetella sp. PMI_491]